MRYYHSGFAEDLSKRRGNSSGNTSDTQNTSQLILIQLISISNFRRVLYVVCFLLGNPPASEFYMPTFRNILSVPFS